MAGIKAWRKIQFGKEATQGTKVDATTIWRGIGTIQDNQETVFPEEDIGILMGVDRSYVPRVEAGLNLESTEATFEQLPYLFEMGLKSVTPTTDANGNGIFTYTFPIQSTDAVPSTDLATYSVRGGDNEAVESFTFGYCRSFTLSGTAGQALMMSAELVGRQVSTDSFTAAVSIPAIEEILFSKGKLYIDPTSTFPATTQKSNTLLDMSLSITPGWTHVYTGDGYLYFSFLKQVQPEVILTITFEHDAISVAEKAYWKAGTARSISLEFAGSSAAKYAKFRMVGKWDNFQQLGERDGNDIVQGTFRCCYNATAAGFFSAVIGTGLASLP